MGVSVGRCLKQNMASRRQRKREKMIVGPGPRECKLNMSQAVVERCALDGEGYAH